MKWAVDRIENEIVVLENIETREKRYVKKELLPSSIHEGAILVSINDEYRLDINEEEKRRQEILEKFKKLRDNN